MPRSNEDNIRMTFKAAADLSDYQYCFVKFSAADTVNICGASEDMIGILQNKPDAAGKAASVVVLGISQLRVDGNAGAITRGTSYLESNSTGEGVVTTTDTDPVGALALASSTAANDQIPVIVVRMKHTG
jgi:hypothetical protein